MPATFEKYFEDNEQECGSMDDRIDTVIGLFEETARSLRKSLGEYWPGGDSHDPRERNVSLHFSHAMLAAGFSAYGEADDKLVDVLGIAPNHQWFLACEFKVLDGVKKLHELMSDVQKLQSFWIRSEYQESKYGAKYSQILKRCEAGFGLVGGLHAAKRDSSIFLDIWSNPDRINASTAAKFNGLGAVFPTPAHVVDFPTGWRYYLLFAVFPISRPE